MSTEQYENICKGEFKDIKILIEKQTEEVKNLHNKLFVGNGTPPITVQIDRLNGFKRFSCWFFSAVIIASIGLVFKLIYNAMA